MGGLKLIEKYKVWNKSHFTEHKKRLIIDDYQPLKERC